MRKFSNIIRKSIALSAVFSLLALNLAAVIPCGQMIVNDECCHVTNAVKPCCVENLKITNEDRLLGHCGCSIKELNKLSDMNVDFTQAHNNNFSVSKGDFSSVINNNVALQNHGYIDYAGHSPPLIHQSLYLLNLSLRI